MRALRYYPEIADLLVLHSRFASKLFKIASVLGVHALLFLMILVNGQKDLYGTLKNSIYVPEQRTHYDFSRIGKTFVPWGYYRLEEIDSIKLEELILAGVPKKLRPRLAKHLAYTLELSEYYQMDPLWVLSIMWTESHFNPKATSPVQAKGLMQIMPGTAHFLMKKMNRPVSHKEATQLTRDAKKNIEMGTFYLRRLFINFGFNYKYSTIAYNMGPNGVWRRLKRGVAVGKNHLYLKKVRKHYNRLLKPIKDHLAQHAAPYTQTLVVQAQWSKLAKQVPVEEMIPDWKIIAQSNNPSQRLEL